MEITNDPHGEENVKTFDRLQREMQALEGEVDALNAEGEQLRATIADKREVWEADLQGRIQRISEHFSASMSSIDCAGEVSCTLVVHYISVYVVL